MLSALFLLGGFFALNFVFADNSSTSLTVGNEAPTVSNVDVSPSPIVLTENTSTTVTITATITDNNGCQSVFASGSVQAVLYRSGLAATSSCTSDENNCYRNITLFEIGNTCTDGSDTTGDASGTIPVWYFAEATDASSTFSGETWQATVTAQDLDGATATSSDGTPPELNTTLALNITASISFGTLSPNTSSSIAQLQVATTTNTGNYNGLDVEFSGTNMTSGGDTIAATQERYGTSSAAYNSLTHQLTTSPVVRDVNLGRNTSSATTAASSTFWGIAVPGGQPNGSYTGTNTFTAK